MTGSSSHFSSLESIYWASSPKIMRFSFFQCVLIFYHSCVEFRNKKKLTPSDLTATGKRSLASSWEGGLGTRTLLLRPAESAHCWESKGFPLRDWLLVTLADRCKARLCFTEFLRLLIITILTCNGWGMGFLKISQLFFTLCQMLRSVSIFTYIIGKNLYS